MDFSMIAVNSPPEHDLEKTGYIYSLSSSYSSAALEYEEQHSLPPIYASPRMSRRRLTRHSGLAVSTTPIGADCEDVSSWLRNTRHSRSEVDSHETVTQSNLSTSKTWHYSAGDTNTRVSYSSSTSDSLPSRLQGGDKEVHHAGIGTISNMHLANGEGQMDDGNFSSTLSLDTREGSFVPSSLLLSACTRNGHSEREQASCCCSRSLGAVAETWYCSCKTSSVGVQHERGFLASTIEVVRYTARSFLLLILVILHRTVLGFRRVYRFLGFGRSQVSAQASTAAAVDIMDTRLSATSKIADNTWTGRLRSRPPADYGASPVFTEQKAYAELHSSQKSQVEGIRHRVTENAEEGALKLAASAPFITASAAAVSASAAAVSASALSGELDKCQCDSLSKRIFGSLNGGLSMSKSVSAHYGDASVERTFSNKLETSESCSSFGSHIVTVLGLPGSSASNMMICSAVHVLYLLFWFLGSGWYQLVAMASQLNVYLLTRRCSKLFLLLLFLLLPLLLFFALRGRGPATIRDSLGGLWPLGLQSDSLSSYAKPLQAPDSRQLLELQFLRAEWASQQDELRRLARTSVSLRAAGARNLQAAGMADSRLVEAHALRLAQVEAALAAASTHERRLSRQLVALTHFTHVLTEERHRVQATPIRREEVEMMVHAALAVQMAKLQERVRAAETAQSSPETAERDIALANLDNKLTALLQRQKELEAWKLSSKSKMSENQEGWTASLSGLRADLQRLSDEVTQMQYSSADLKANVKTCCQQSPALAADISTQVENELGRILVAMADGSASPALVQALGQWLNSRYVSHAELERELRVAGTQAATPSKSMLYQKLSGQAGGLSEERVKTLMHAALSLYHADRTGMADLALESVGGSILSTRCSETYESRAGLLSFLGIPLWSQTQSPRVVIQPDIQPGNCWAFRGTYGYVVIRLAQTAHLTAFSVEHIPRSLATSGNIDSAPRDFSVYGLEDESQEEGDELGHYIYEKDGEPLQSFAVQFPTDKPFRAVELRIFSNWGHPEYTCLYRFRVHGMAQPKNDASQH
uniref:SUN domain-containing protein 2-like isoform X2 n=1 Tax=Myxine glutinosa TaxID=7769 RepID=UPI00358EA368